jgi:hypothetical protein
MMRLIRVIKDINATAKELEPEECSALLEVIIISFGEILGYEVQRLSLRGRGYLFVPGRLVEVPTEEHIRWVDRFKPFGRILEDHEDDDGEDIY